MDEYIDRWIYIIHIDICMYNVYVQLEILIDGYIDIEIYIFIDGYIDNLWHRNILQGENS